MGKIHCYYLKNSDKDNFDIQQREELYQNQENVNVHYVYEHNYTDELSTIVSTNKYLNVVMKTTTTALWKCRANCCFCL